MGGFYAALFFMFVAFCAGMGTMKMDWSKELGDCAKKLNIYECHWQAVPGASHD